MEEKIKKGRFNKFAKSLGGFIGRLIVNVSAGLITSSIHGLVLAYLLKCIWNDLVIYLELKIKLLTFWTAFEIIFLISFVTTMCVVRKAKKSGDKEFTEA